jgi:hypothetical protein
VLNWIFVCIGLLLNYCVNVLWNCKVVIGFHISFASFFVSSVECLEMMPSWCRQVNWENCGNPWANCAVLCVKDDWKDGSEACAISCQNCTVYSVFPSGMTLHSKTAQFNWECVGRFTRKACVRFFSVCGKVADNQMQSEVFKTLKSQRRFHYKLLP